MKVAAMLHGEGGLYTEKLSLTGKSKHSVDDQMKGLSALFVDGDEIFIDNGGIHAKSRIERGIQFVRTLEEVPNPKEVLGYWITLHRFETGQGFYGAMPFTMYVDSEAAIGYKNLSEQVNHMDKAVRGNVMTDQLSPELKKRIATFLKSVRADLWEHASEQFQNAFSTLDE